MLYVYSLNKNVPGICDNMLDLDHIQGVWSFLTSSLTATETDTPLPALCDPYTVSLRQRQMLSVRCGHGDWKGLSK